jgi:hypothetical protein
VARTLESQCMNEGWCGDNYLILFDESEVASTSERYAISQMLPGYQVVGLCGWDDFILRDSVGRTHLVPTIPADLQRVSPYVMPPSAKTLRSDERLCGMIKWYVKPVVFGGDANVGENLIWVSHERHAQLVKWWNDRYRSISR